jgi:hypothetical protein
VRVVLIQAMTENQVNRQNELEQPARATGQQRRTLAFLWLGFEELNQAVESSERVGRRTAGGRDHGGVAALN